MNSQSMEHLVVGSNRRRKAAATGKPLNSKLKDKLWNPREGTMLNRDAESWGRICLFYFLFYLALFAFTITLLMFFLHANVTVDYDYPTYNYKKLYFDKKYSDLVQEKPDLDPGVDNRIGLILPGPGMGFRPVPDYQSTLVRFIQGRPSSYKKFTDHIQAFLDMYENEKQEGENFIDCDNIHPSSDVVTQNSRDKTKVCRFNVDVLGDGCTWQKDYGYDDGQPCVLLKLNKVFGWEPVPYVNNASRPEVLGDRWDPDHIGITCEGEGPLDEENIGPLQFWPDKGLPIMYYPYLNQEGYRPPVVFVKFLRPANGIVINVWCKAWARNIRHHREDRAGSIHFEMLVD